MANITIELTETEARNLAALVGHERRRTYKASDPRAMEFWQFIENSLIVGIAKAQGPLIYSAGE